MCMRQSLDFPNRIQSPLNYTGGKFRLLPQILPLFPANIDVLVDLFCGGGNVGINTSAERIVLNDSDKNVIRIFRLFRQYPTEQILEIIDGIIDRYGLSDSRTNGYAFYQCESARGLGTYNKEGYNRLRSELNNMKRRNDRYFFMLFTLIVFAFNNQIRFNEKREFNLPVGKRDFNNNMRNKVRHFAEAIKNPHIELSSNDFRRIPFDGLSEHSLIYADPPYLITCATYNENNGHVFLPKDKLLNATCQLLGCGMEQVETALDALAESHAVVIQRIANVEAVYLRRLWEAEISACARLLALLEVDADRSRFADKAVAEIEREQGITYAPLQRQAVELAAKVGVILLTGGPGTGKTTTVRGIVALFQKMGLNIVLAAPTGRAAKRMSELTGMEAQTVHRLLGMTWNEASHQVTFQKTEKEPLEAEAVIVDEMSMVDVSLFSALLRALRPGTRLVLVGDADQLPSVGAGNVFSDLIRSKKIETVFLREVFRQAEQSAIIRNAHRVNLGESPELKGNQGDFFFLCRRDAQRAVSTVLELCRTRLPDNMHIPVDQIQVLTPTRKGPCGTMNLNRLLQEALNPRTPGKREILWGERVFRVGDRIMQTRNDYDVVWEKADGTVGTGMFNGDVGRIVEIDQSGEWLALDFDGRTAPYSTEMLSEIDLAYAQTIHKAQGSEYRCVVLAAMPSAPSLMVRGVLYTALTRARELLVIVGDDAAVRSMAANDKQQKRYSGLKWRLCHAGDANEE